VPYLASSSSQRTASAMSSAEPARPSGVAPSIACLSASGLPCSGHSTAPGDTPLTRTCGASSSASERVIAASAAFAIT
jgi:hypothetical protein